MGSPQRANSPSTQVRAAKRIVISKVTGTNIGQLLSGRPAMFIGYSKTLTQYCRPKPARQPTMPPTRTSSGSREWWWPSASVSSSMGKGA
jgi:hypothetical protein